MDGRTRRRDIGEFTSRKPETVEVDFTPPQRQLHDDLLAAQRPLLQQVHGDANLKFMMTTIRREAASSPIRKTRLAKSTRLASFRAFTPQQKFTYTKLHMNDRETRRYDMFGRVQTFGKDNATDFAAGSTATGHFAAVTQVIKDLDTEKAKQGGGTATAKEVLLDALRLDLQNIARTARAIGEKEPGFADKFQTPGSPSQSALLTAADAFVLELDKAGVAAKFIAYELPATFVQDLKDDIAAIANADTDMESDDQEGVASTAAVGRLIKAGMAEVTQLDAIMHNKYARNPDKLRAWESASHIERAPKREKNPAGGSTPPKPNP